ncbi:heterogeneous nuclear ribonucleo U 1 [Olea europaea subsp. europaea]|uniref:Heterogeneous nuclear ribonucleo U 1 n=2 Tax=Olea europaea subsp. europaea TaxID=158383 RepID=A0A8S0TC40_OLEEU|nr:heterogeneous nuclear ribonucleo U 1 [Olea europaea subsp. europaea]
MASVEREPPGTDGSEPGRKRQKVKVTESDTTHPPVLLNPADCDIDFNIEGNGLQGSAICEEGFSYCWSGARANVGVIGGKYCFGCKIVSAQPVDMKDTPIDQQHVCRLGISRGDDAVGNLGETAHSFGFGGTGKFSNYGKFSGYGESFGVGDTIICAVDLENKHMASIGFSKNGKWMGVAKHFDAGPRGLGVVNSSIKKLQWESALFPHILLKNVIVQMQFSIEDGLVPEEGYKPWASAIEDGNTVLGPTFSNGDCEVIMMVGLPASGKTTWAENWKKEHPEKRYVLLGTNLALEQMKVPGLLRKHNYGERFEHLMDRATGIFNTLLSRASKMPRNFIIDQTNVFKGARKRKLKPFADYRKIAVVVFPRPEELKLRAAKRFKEMGKEVPAEAVNSMLANYSLPKSMDMHGTDEYFDEVLFTELSRAESQRFLEEMKRDMNANRDMSPYSNESSTRSYCTSLQHGHGASIQSRSGFSLQNQSCSPGVGGHWNSSYSSQPPSGGAYGSYYSSPSVCESRHDFDRKGGSHSGGFGELYRSYEGGKVHNFAGVENESFLPRGTTDPGRSSIVDHYSETAPSSYHTCQRYAISSQRPPPSLSATRPDAYHFSTPSTAHGSYPTTIPRPPYDNFLTNSHHAGVYPQPRLPPPPVNFPTGMPRPGVYPPPRSGYH